MNSELGWKHQSIKMHLMCWNFYYSNQNAPLLHGCYFDCVTMKPHLWIDWFEKNTSKLLFFSHRPVEVFFSNETSRNPPLPWGWFRFCSSKKKENLNLQPTHPREGLSFFLSLKKGIWDFFSRRRAFENFFPQGMAFENCLSPFPPPGH